MIGILDSGLGGLAVARALEEYQPALDITYLGDTGRSPYGGRSADRIIAYADQGVDFLVRQGAALIVFASTSISSAVLNNPGGTYAVPVVDAISPSASLAVELSTSRRIGIVGPDAVVGGGAFEKRIAGLDPAAKVYANAAPLLAPMIEEGRLDRPETRMIVKKYLHPLKVRQVDVLIMGCSWYALIQRTIQRKIGRRVSLVDCAATLADYVKRYIRKHAQSGEVSVGKGTRAYYLTDVTERIGAVGKAVYGRNITFRRCDL